jgi:hypothetical protein
MKKYEIIVEDEKVAELTALLQNLPYVKDVRESDSLVDFYTLASERSLSEEWMVEEDDELQKMYGK